MIKHHKNDHNRFSAEKTFSWIDDQYIPKLDKKVKEFLAKYENMRIKLKMSLKVNKKKRKRFCSKCLNPGHTKRTCTQ